MKRQSKLIILSLVIFIVFFNKIWDFLNEKIDYNEDIDRNTVRFVFLKFN